MEAARATLYVHVSTRGIISETTFLEEADVSTVSSDVDETQLEDSEVCGGVRMSSLFFETHARAHARASSLRVPNYAPRIFISINQHNNATTIIYIRRRACIRACE